MISYETYALVRDIVVAQELQPITMKGISREVVPYAVKGILGAAGETIRVFSEHLTGLDFYLNANMIDATNAGHVRKVLQDAIDALDKNGPGMAAGSSSRCNGACRPLAAALAQAHLKAAHAGYPSRQDRDGRGARRFRVPRHLRQSRRLRIELQPVRHVLSMDTTFPAMR